MDYQKKIEQSNKDTNILTDISSKADTITMRNPFFLQYWLYAAFPYCYGFRRYLLRNLPYPQEWVNHMFGVDAEQEITPICRTVVIDKQEITVLLYRYHIEYRIGDTELFYPYFSYFSAEALDDDAFFLLLPMIDVTMCRYLTGDGHHCLELERDLIQRFFRLPLPKEHIQEVACNLKLGLEDADGAEEAPMWIVWQETVNNLYGAMWWQGDGNGTGELEVFKHQSIQEITSGYTEYIAAGSIDCLPEPEGVNLFLWARKELSKRVSLLE